MISDTHSLSLHDALPIYNSIAPGLASLQGLFYMKNGHLGRCFSMERRSRVRSVRKRTSQHCYNFVSRHLNRGFRSEEHTSELQSRGHLVCRLLLEKKKIT